MDHQLSPGNSSSVWFISACANVHPGPVFQKSALGTPIGGEPTSTSHAATTASNLMPTKDSSANALLVSPKIRVATGLLISDCDAHPTSQQGLQIKPMVRLRATARLRPARTVDRCGRECSATRCTSMGRLELFLQVHVLGPPLVNGGGADGSPHDRSQEQPSRSQHVSWQP